MAEEAAFILDGGPDGAIPVNYPDGSPGMAVYDRIDNEKGKQLVVGYRVPDELRIAARRVLRGGLIYTGPGFISRTLPHSIDWDEPAENVALYCQDVTGKPGGPLRDSLAINIANPPVHTDANLTVTYTSRKYQLLTDAEVTSGGQQNELLRYIAYPPPRVKDVVRTGKGATFVWEGTVPLRDCIDALFITDAEIEWPITWLQVPIEAIPWRIIQDYMNSTNSVAFSRYQFLPLNRCVFSGLGIEDITLPNGREGANVTYCFTTKNHGANEFPDKERGFRFFPLLAKDLSGNRPHVAKDHRNLFKPV